MLRLYYSNRLEVLSQALATTLKHSDLAVFEAPHILVQSQGMSRWINAELAMQLGIAANIHFPFPASYIWSLFASEFTHLPEQSPFDKSILIWRIAKALPQFMDDADFAVIKSYLADDKQGVKCYQLAGRIADVFDQYLVYRPAYLAAWEKRLPIEQQQAIDDLLGQNEHSIWQQKLWQHLLEKVDESQWHRARVADEFMVLAKQKRLQFKQAPKQLFIFGISALPAAYMQVLSQLAEVSEVHLFILNPCYEYWGDIVSSKQQANRQAFIERKRLNNTIYHDYEPGNDLLASWGRLGQEQQLLLQELTQQMHKLQEYEFYQDWDGETLLQYVQNDILRLENRYQFEANKTALLPEQLNIQVHNCHSKMRELEVLHDQLLHAFNHTEGLKPQDIVVMVPDIDSYAPYIQAVFASKKSAHYIPFAVADRDGSQEHSLLKAFFAVLDLASSDFKQSDVLALFDYPEVINAFGFNDIEQLKKWIGQANIRWGLNLNQHQKQGLNSAKFSWLYGLMRMLNGYVLSPENHLGIAGVDAAPLSHIQGVSALDVGNFARFIDALITLELLCEAKTPQAWSEALHTLLDLLFELDEQQQGLLQIIRDAISDLEEHTQKAAYEDTLAYPVVLDYLRNEIAIKSQGQHFLSGQVNFCTLMPMRAIPFKWVAILGLSDGAFPRQQPSLGFDLFKLESQLGDRSRRDDDRYLFLEALLSAREHVHLSYIGRSIKDNSLLEPSILLTELIEYIDRSFVMANSGASALLEQLCIIHKLQPFDSAYFQTNKASVTDHHLYSYADDWLKAVTQATEQQVFFDDEVIAFDSNSIELDELQVFLQHPARFILARKLGIDLQQREQKVEIYEPFALDALSEFQLNEKLLAEQIAGIDRELALAKIDAQGLLPAANFSQIAGDKMSNQVEQMLAAIPADMQALWQEEQTDVSIKLDLSDFQIQGLIPHVGSGVHLRWRSGKPNPVFVLEVWLEHLALAASGLGRESYIVFKTGETWRLGCVSQQQACEQLNMYAHLMCHALKSPFMYAPKAAFAYLEKIRQHPDQIDKALEQAQHYFYGVKSKFPEQDEWYLQLFAGRELTFDETFAANAEQIFALLWDKLSVDEGKA